MKKISKNVLVGKVALSLVILFAGCSSKGKDQTAESAELKETQYVEYWTVNDGGYKNYEKDGPTSKMLIDKTGVGIYNPLVVWDGGNTYFQKLQTRVASGNLPDVFLPWKGIESDLIKQGAIVDLQDYLPKYAPHIWNRIPKDVWDIVRAADPTGKGGIYYVPKVTLSNIYGGVVRKDWLDKVGLPLPTTQDDYVNMLKAFRDKDPNGNGQKDELPVSGREQGRWLDNIFASYDVAMFEGYPQWDLYNDELTFSAITPNMKDALKFLNGLYKEKLLDNNTFLNKSNDWWARITSEKVGTFFHLPGALVETSISQISKTNPNVNLVGLPLPKVQGYQGYITQMRINRPEYVIAKKSEQTTINALKVLDFINDPANTKETSLGLQDINYKVENGKAVMINQEKSKVEAILKSNITDWETTKLTHEIAIQNLDDAGKKNEDMQFKALSEVQNQMKPIAGDGIPASIYDGYADIKNNTLYQEYMAKIIIGEWSIEKFDEFVDKWKKTGGDEVTKKARDWYKTIKK